MGDSVLISPRYPIPMTPPDLIYQAPASTPADRRSRGRRGLPEDLLREASRRLGIIALLASVLWIVGSVLGHIATWIQFRDPEWLRFQTIDAVAAVSSAVSFGLFLYTRRSARGPGFLLDLGQGFLIFTAVALGLMWHMDPPPADWLVTPAMSWIGVVVIMFAAIVPSTSLQTLLTGLIAVSMNPLGMALAKARGVWDFGSGANVFLMHIPITCWSGWPW